MTEGEPKKDWYAIGWERGVEAAQRAIAQASNVYDALERIEELKKPSAVTWKGRRYYEGVER